VNDKWQKLSWKSAATSNGQRWGCTSDPDEIRRDFAHSSRNAIGVPTGEVNQIFVIEGDTIKGHGVDGLANLRKLEAEHGKLPDTLMAESPTGSLHYYFKMPPGVTIRSGGLISGVDVKGDGGMVIAPPSVRPGVGAYRWLNDAPIADAPQWLLDMVVSKDDSEDQPDDQNLQAEHSEVIGAVAVIPNIVSDDRDHDVDRKKWIDVGIAIYGATNGERPDIYDAWSRRHPSYNKKYTAEKWVGFHANRKGMGSLIHLAREAWPDWKDDAEADAVVQQFAQCVHEAGLIEQPLPNSHGYILIIPREAGSAQHVNGHAAAPAPPSKPNGSAGEPPQQSASALTQRPDLNEPLDLWASFEPTKLPTGLLPGIIEQFARDESTVMGADVAGLAMGALAVCAAIITDRVKIQVKEHSDGWQESARIWVALIGPPSTKKSPILRRVARPLIQIDAALFQNYIGALKEYEALPPEERKSAPQPEQRRLRLEDTTIEAAQMILAVSPDGVLCLQDELSGWFGMMDKYAGNRGASKDRAFWLQSYNGGQYVFNRIGRGGGLISNLSVSMLGGIQPEVMRKVADGTVDDGALQRLCPIILRPTTVGQDVPYGTGQQYDQLIEQLYKLPMPNEFCEVTLRFSGGAQAIRRQLEQTHLSLMMAWEVVNKKLAAHIGKYDGLFARLCVLWHCVEHAHDTKLSEIITEETARRVEAFMHKFLLRHAFAFYTDLLGLSDDHDRLAAVAGYVLAHKSERLTTRDIQRGDRTMRKMDYRETDKIFQQLEAFGWLFRREGKRPGAMTWEVNPRVHTLFNERAATEEMRRQEVRKIMASLTRQ
jgi:hypothetical protein